MKGLSESDKELIKQLKIKPMTKKEIVLPELKESE